MVETCGLFFLWLRFDNLRLGSGNHSIDRKKKEEGRSKVSSIKGCMPGYHIVIAIKMKVDLRGGNHLPDGTSSGSMEKKYTKQAFNT